MNISTGKTQSICIIYWVEKITYKYKILLNIFSLIGGRQMMAASTFVMILFNFLKILSNTPFYI